MTPIKSRKKANILLFLIVRGTLREDVDAGRSYDCCAVRLDVAAAHLAEVTGLSSPAEVLDRVFSQFCIGK